MEQAYQILAEMGRGSAPMRAAFATFAAARRCLQAVHSRTRLSKGAAASSPLFDMCWVWSPSEDSPLNQVDVGCGDEAEHCSEVRGPAAWGEHAGPVLGPVAAP